MYGVKCMLRLGIVIMFDFCRVFTDFSRIAVQFDSDTLSLY